MSKLSGQPYFTEDRINGYIGFFRYYFLFLAILALVVFLGYIVLDERRFDVLGSAAISGVIYYGISNRKSWVTIVITLLAAWGIVSNIFSPTNLLASLLAIAFQTFQIYFFNRKDVKSHFNTKGTTIF